MGELREAARVQLPTVAGEFDVRAFTCGSGCVYLALIKGDLGDGRSALTRVHSECLTGDALGSLRCDCGAQLDLGMRALAAEGRGVLIYATDHEGRGIGLLDKLRAYMEQEAGADTVDANLRLGLAPDGRRYDNAAAVLKALGVRSVRLSTNNPPKVKELQTAGITVEEVVSVPALPHLRNQRYLRTKQERFGHLNLIGDPLPAERASRSIDVGWRSRHLRNCSAFTSTSPARFRPAWPRRSSPATRRHPGLSADERRAYEQLTTLYTRRRGYASMMGTRPQTLYGVADSPVGLAAWLLDHGDGWGQPAAPVTSAVLGHTSHGHPAGDLTRDDVLDNITLYWLTNTGVSSARLYWENKLSLYNAADVSVPAAVSVFPGENYQAPHSWAEQAYHNLIYYNQPGKGGHFAACEQPRLFSEEVRAGLRPLRK